MFTPSHLDVLLHYHVSPTPHPRAHAPAVKEHTEDLHRLGLLEPAKFSYGGKWTTSLKGNAYVASLCAAPLPEAQLAWVIPAQAERRIPCATLSLA